MTTPISAFEIVAIALSTISALIWIGLLTVWGRFWLANQRLDSLPVSAGLPLAHSHRNAHETDLTQTALPSVAVIIPARNEAELIALSVRSHFHQTYSGSLSIVLIDDQSTDGTAAAAIQASKTELPSPHRSLTVLQGKPLPPSWTGKLWAMEQGFHYLQQQDDKPDYVLFTDADIEHAPDSIQQLVLKAESDRLDLVSLMVKLRCQSAWEKLLIPAFVFFFQMLYPFPWVNNSRRKTAAAAGGCVLVRYSALVHIDGLQAIRNALIDDCALGRAIKEDGDIWLGLSTTTCSLRPYDTLESIWQMVARSAYTQLRYSPFLLVGTVIGMLIVYAAPPLAVAVGLCGNVSALTLIGAAGWGLMAIAYWPTIKLYGGSLWLAFALPGIAFLYLLMTLDSARQHWRGQGGSWKGRIYTSP